jgi:PRC-barrel domain protein
MFEATDIREWRGHDVVDAEGHKIGELEAIYVDTSTDQPTFATVTVGMPTRHRLTFVPLDHATVGPGYVRVGYDRKLVKDAPSIDTDGELPASDEEAMARCSTETTSRPSGWTAQPDACREMPQSIQSAAHLRTDPSSSNVPRLSTITR